MAGQVTASGGTIAVIYEDPSFWQGAGATGLTALVALWVRRVTRRESLEERLQRWQEATVAQVRQENISLRIELAEVKARALRVPVMEACLRLAVDALHRLCPNSPELRQIGVLLSRAVPIDPTVPDEMRDILNRIRWSDEGEVAGP
jgi:hypothetical protein